MQISAAALSAPLTIASFTAKTLDHCIACLGVTSGLVAVGTSGDACPGAVQLWANSTDGWNLTATVTAHNATLVGCDFGRVVHLAGSSVLAVGVPDADGGVGLVEVYDVADPTAPQHVESVLWQRHLGVTHLVTQGPGFQNRRQPRSARYGRRWACEASASRSQAALRGPRSASSVYGFGGSD